MASARVRLRLDQAGHEAGQVVTIGRQNCFVTPSQVRAAIAKFGLGPVPEVVDLSAMIPYVEPVLEMLGAESVDSIDNSDYEGATRVWDMNRPIPEEWFGQFDMLYDGGSLEHIFNVPQALANYMNLVRVGGAVIICTMANNWMGHGFYQIGPELFYRSFCESNGFRVDRVVVFENYLYARTYDVPDPASIRSRIELSNPWLGVGIIMQATRIRDVVPFATWPQQSDYTRQWTGDADQNGHAPSQRLLSVYQSIRDRFKRRLPGLVYWKHAVLSRYPALGAWTWRRRRIAYHKTHGFTAQPDRFIVKQ